MNSNTISRMALLSIAAYVAAQMLSDIASLKIGVVAGLSVDMGTFIYPITFTLRDLVHKSTGKKNAQTLIITCALINLFMVGYLMIAVVTPSDPDWHLGEQFAAIFSPTWRIVVASIIAEMISELVDTEAYEWFIRKISAKHQWGRVLFSNSVSIPIDNAVFSIGAFGFLLPWSVVGEIFLMNLIVKYGITLFSLPMIYLTPEGTRQGTEKSVLYEG